MRKVMARLAAAPLLFKFVMLPRLNVTDCPLPETSVLAGFVATVTGWELVIPGDQATLVTSTNARAPCTVSTMLALVVTPCGTVTVSV